MLGVFNPILHILFVAKLTKCEINLFSHHEKPVPVLFCSKNIMALKILVFVVLALAGTLAESWEGEYEHTVECGLREAFFEPKCLGKPNAEKCFIWYLFLQYFRI